MTARPFRRSPIRREIRVAVLRRSHGQCEDCERRSRLELHHLTYLRDSHRVPESIFGYETADDLVGLCRECHHQRHVDINGDFWADIDEMHWHWDAFEHAMEKDD